MTKQFSQTENKVGTQQDVVEAELGQLTVVNIASVMVAKEPAASSWCGECRAKKNMPNANSITNKMTKKLSISEMICHTVSTRSASSGKPRTK